MKFSWAVGHRAVLRHYFRRWLSYYCPSLNRRVLERRQREHDAQPGRMRFTLTTSHPPMIPEPHYGTRTASAEQQAAIHQEIFEERERWAQLAGHKAARTQVFGKSFVAKPEPPLNAMRLVVPTPGSGLPVPPLPQMMHRRPDATRTTTAAPATAMGPSSVRLRSDQPILLSVSDIRYGR